MWYAWGTGNEYENVVGKFQRRRERGLPWSTRENSKNVSHGLDSTFSGWGSAVDLCEHGNEFAVSVRVQNYCRIKSNIVWDVSPCSPLKVSRCSEGKCRLYEYIQEGRTDQSINQHEAGRKFCYLYGFITPYCGTKFSDFSSMSLTNLTVLRVKLDCLILS
jgi:hypothetical protein